MYCVNRLFLPETIFFFLPFLTVEFAMTGLPLMETVISSGAAILRTVRLSGFVMSNLGVIIGVAQGAAFFLAVEVMTGVSATSRVLAVLFLKKMMKDERLDNFSPSPLPCGPPERGGRRWHR